MATNTTTKNSNFKKMPRVCSALEGREFLFVQMHLKKKLKKTDRNQVAALYENFLDSDTIIILTRYTRSRV